MHLLEKLICDIVKLAAMQNVFNIENILFTCIWNWKMIIAIFCSKIFVLVEYANSLTIDLQIIFKILENLFFMIGISTFLLNFKIFVLLETYFI